MESITKSATRRLAPLLTMTRREASASTNGSSRPVTIRPSPSLGTQFVALAIIGISRLSAHPLRAWTPNAWSVPTTGSRSEGFDVQAARCVEYASAGDMAVKVVLGALGHPAINICICFLARFIYISDCSAFT